MVTIANIKIKDNTDRTIKKLDKKSIIHKNLKSTIVNVKEKTQNGNTTNEANVNEYASNRLYNGTRTNINRAKSLNKIGKESFDVSKQNIIKAKEKVIGIKTRIKSKSNIKTATKNIKNTKILKNSVSSSGKYIKTSKNTAKLAEKASKKAIKNSQRMAKMIKKATEETIKNVRRMVLVMIKAIKAIITALSNLITLLIAGGWVVLVIILVICMIGLMVSSVWGIFFSSEDTGNSSRTMTSVVSELNTEFMNKLTSIQNDNAHDEYDITGERAEWKDIIAVYAAKETNGKDDIELMTLNDNRINLLKDIFWKMNDITFATESETTEQTIIHLTWTEHKTVTYTKLHITITRKSVDDMINEYNFNSNQLKQLNELRSEQYASMWNSVIYGTSVGNSDIVVVARQQIGNVGGQPYWSWYGFNSRVEWCATFVSWCANQCGYIQSGIIPKFANCQNEGIPWFKTCGLWKDGGYIPKSGDIIFFDWEQDGKSDHVGIVDRVENNKVYTVEGNSDDSCRERNYDVNSGVIVGYGTPAY